MRKVTLLFAALLSLTWGTMKAETLTANFNSGLPEGWSIVGDVSRNSDRARSGSGVWTSSKSDNANYLITEAVEGSITFYARAYNKSSNSYVFIYKYNGSALGDQIYVTPNMKTSSTPSWSSYTADLGDYKGQVAIALNYAAIDDVTYTQMEAVEGPALTVKDGETKLTSPYTYNFGLAVAGTTKTFLLSNPGTTDLGVSVSETGSFGATLSASTIAAGGEATFTVTMPSTSGSSTVTITPAAGSGIDPFVINVSGTIRDANKVYLDFADGQMPEGWTSVGLGSYTSDSYAWTASTGYVGISASSSSYSQAFTSPKLVFAKDEQVFFETAKYGSSTWYNPSIVVEYSLDGTTWTAIGSAFTDDVYGTWTPRSVTIPVEGVKYIRFNGWYVYLRNIYGGELAQEPNMVVTQPASLDFGVIDAETTKTFTIANTGHATLEGISVTSSNAAFTITGAPASLEAGTSAEVTITMTTTTTGALSSDITVSATDMTDVQFTVTGVVLPEGLMVVDFNDNALPANWTNAASSKWSFSEGKAYCTSAAELVTPKLSVADGDMLVITATSYDNYDNNYLEVYGSADGTSWDLIQKFVSRSQIPYGSYATLVVTGIPTTAKYLKFKGYYIRVDEIAGLTYAPVLSVAQGETAVSSPAAYDFGECADNASVTYNFTNAGAGTIEITNVAVTGEGAAAYSTNWTASTAVPFNLEITRTYVAGREGASEATVTVTTTEGDFVINVTGTDKAANAPELAVTPAEDADFGVVTAATSKTYTVTNAGTGTLSVNIYSSDAKFTVAPAQLTDIVAGESKTFEVTFTPVAETYGTFTAEIVVVPTYDESAAVPFNASAKVKDPNIWSEDFSAGTVPTGWNVDSNWTISGGTANAAYAYGSTSYYLTTPVLTVSDASDEMTFDYEATANYVSIKIQMSKDGGAFADYQTISGLNNGDAGTYTITGLEAGDYQFRFANDDYKLDNFEGFKLNLADHIISIAASTIPESSSYTVTMKEGRSFEATVTVKEMRGVAEEVTAKLYMGTEVIGTANGSVAANGTETLTITATPTTSATDGIEMHIEVEYAGGTVSTDPVTRYVAAVTYLVLDETSSDDVVAGTYDYVTLKRTFAAGWNTVCLPFTINDVEGFFGTGAKAYEYSKYDNGELNFAAVTTLSASYPYIVYVPTAMTEDIELTDITVASADASPWYTSKNGAYLRGTYAPIAAGEWTKSAETDVIYGLTTEGRIAKAGANASMKGFRAYFDIPSGSSVKALRFEDIEDAISLIQTDAEENEAIYNVAGQRVQKMQKGINIINGKKILK